MFVVLFPVMPLSNNLSFWHSHHPSGHPVKFADQFFPILRFLLISVLHKTELSYNQLMTRLCLCGNHQHAHPSTCMLLSVAQCCPVLPSIAQCCSVLPAWKQRGWEGKGAMEVGRAEHTTWKTPFLTLDWAAVERTQFSKSKQV